MMTRTVLLPLTGTCLTMEVQTTKESGRSARPPVLAAEVSGHITAGEQVGVGVTPAAGGEAVAGDAVFEPNPLIETVDGSPKLFDPAGIWIMFGQQQVSGHLLTESLKSCQHLMEDEAPDDGRPSLLSCVAATGRGFSPLRRGAAARTSSDV